MGVALVAAGDAHEQFEEGGVVEAVEGLVELADAVGDAGWADVPPDDAVGVPGGGRVVLGAVGVEPGLLPGELEDAVLDVGVEGGDPPDDVALVGGVEQAVVAALAVVVVGVDGAAGVAGEQWVVDAEQGDGGAAVV